MNLRVRGPRGVVTLGGLDALMPLSAFRDLVAEKTGVAAPCQEFLNGFPPTPVSLPAHGSSNDPSLSDCPIYAGDTLVLRELPAQEGSSAAPPSSSPVQPNQVTVPGVQALRAGVFCPECMLCGRGCCARSAGCAGAGVVPGVQALRARV
ncbi:hypothetical protein CYMTET_20050, partial [Cymbomonas tetramitiformis]